MIEPATLPDKVRTRDQWVCWEVNSRGRKAPIDPERDTFASLSADETWCDLETALEYLEANPTTVNGLGFVVRKSDPFIGVVLNDCRDSDTGELSEQAKTILCRLDSYTEISPSGTGLHIFITGTLPEGRAQCRDVEMHDQHWFLPFTGNHLPGTPQQVKYHHDGLKAIHRLFVREAGDNVHKYPPKTPLPTSVSAPGLSDDALIDLARNASNGAQFERLWNGTAGGYSSHAAADMALCQLLAFWTGGHAVQMDRLFQRSALARPKWREIHYADGSTYGERTIERAIEHTSVFYKPPVQTCDVCGESGETPQDREFAYLKEKVKLLKSDRLSVSAQLERARDRVTVLERRLERLEGRPSMKEQDSH